MLSAHLRNKLQRMRGGREYGKTVLAGISYTSEQHDTGKGSIEYGRGGSTGCGRCCHHSYPKLSEKKNWTEDTSVLSRNGIRIVLELSPIPYLIKHMLEDRSMVRLPLSSRLPLSN